MKKQQTVHSVGSPYVNKKHLPMMGVGPVYVAVIIAVTVIAVIAGRNGIFEKGGVPSLKIPLLIMGILLIVLGIFLWAGAMFRSKIDSHILENNLATTGVYALVRNPIYSAFMFLCTGALMVAGNVFFLPLFFFYWIFMTVLMKCTEERWLKKLYGREYEEYCSKVNRCIPRLPGRR
ncbi:MAG: isoprenylcysteine carboxylmethyltransferase family protein [Clostridium sp.]|nr:isoprenylcysteine carboxylmethyltransferase family protein [Acetatifactor muris]MCM1526271.1 isoprenylcysteine carboxylmethyltransferase family protein [Bacteroides sp.]MCM1562912.1 isoprenylcysteine carboxylmethyltransferase family protein [Clostridium sp.]